MRAFDEDAVKHLFKISTRTEIVAILPKGMLGEAPAPKPRKELSEIFFREDWQTPWLTR